jgi:hypothetical protein
MPLNFPLHFTCLAVAVAVLILTQGGQAPHGIDRATFLFGLVGLLHATALTIAISKPHAFARRLIFIVIATLLSAGVPVVGAYVVSHFNSGGALGFIALYAVSSAFGAATYWVLVRSFWFPTLTARSLLHAVGMCVGATLGSLVVSGLITQQGRYPSEFAQVLPTVFWWFAFSLSLWTFARGLTISHDAVKPSARASSLDDGVSR